MRFFEKLPRSLVKLLNSFTTSSAKSDKNRNIGNLC